MNILRHCLPVVVGVLVGAALAVGMHQSHAAARYTAFLFMLLWVAEVCRLKPWSRRNAR